MGDNGNQLDTLLLDADGVARLLHISRSHLYGLHSSGRLGPMPIRLGKSSRWRRDEMERWITSDCPPRQKWQAMKEASR
jgi:predicted DNA-binding transcriptional regulator AlpA